MAQKFLRLYLKFGGKPFHTRRDQVPVIFFKAGGNFRISETRIIRADEIRSDLFHTFLGNDVVDLHKSAELMLSRDLADPLKEKRDRAASDALPEEFIQLTIKFSSCAFL